MNALYRQIETELAEPIAENGDAPAATKGADRELHWNVFGGRPRSDHRRRAGSLLTPRAEHLGAAGRVDVVGERDEATLILQLDSKWVHLQARQPTLRTEPFNESTLAEVLQLVMRDLTAMAGSFIVSANAERQTLDEIRYWHRGVVAAFSINRLPCRMPFVCRTSVPDRFLGMTESDVDAHYDTQRRELDRLTVLSLVATEATIRVDYFRHVNGKLKGELAVAYRKWHKTLTDKKSVSRHFDDNGILHVLKKTDVMNNNIIGRYRECLRPALGRARTVLGQAGRGGPARPGRRI